LPLQLASWLGVGLIGLCALAMLATVLGVTGLSTFISSLLIGGVQLLCLGILGEYLGRIYDEVKGRPLYLIDRVWNSVSTPSP